MAAGERSVLLVVGGAAAPVGGRTPLADAETPGLDDMARRGSAGTVHVEARSPWEGFVALLGLRPEEASLGACEAVGARAEIPEGACAWRADFVTADDAGLHDPRAGKVQEAEAELLLAAAGRALPGCALRRLAGHRNLLVAPGPAEFAPSPWEMVGRRPAGSLDPDGRLRGWYDAVRDALAAHDVNAVRVDLLENPANALWFHGAGPAVRSGLRSPVGGEGVVLVGRGGVTSGLAAALGWTARVVDGDEDALAGEVLAALAAAGTVVVRTETPLTRGADGPDARRDALSAVDARLVRPILGALEEREGWTFAVAADSVFDPATHALLRRPVPAVVLRHGDAGDGGRFDEGTCERSGARWDSGAAFAGAVAAR